MCYLTLWQGYVYVEVERSDIIVQYHEYFGVLFDADVDVGRGGDIFEAEEWSGADAGTG